VYDCEVSTLQNVNELSFDDEVKFKDEKVKFLSWK
jgi:hypothetical protein